MDNVRRRHIHKKQFLAHTKNILSNFILVCGIVAVGLPVINQEITKRIWEAATANGEINCPPSLVNQSNNLDSKTVLSVLGAGMTLDNGTWVPNSFEKGRITAAAGLYAVGYLGLNGNNVDVLMQDGRMPIGANENSTTHMFQEMVEKLSYGTMQIPPSRILSEHSSVNTDSGMDVLVQLGKEKGWSNYFIVTDEFHKQRVKEEAIEHGLCPTIISVEEYAKLFNPTMSMRLKQREDSQGMRKREIKEDIGLLLHIYNPLLSLRTMYKQLGQ